MARSILLGDPAISWLPIPHSVTRRPKFVEVGLDFWASVTDGARMDAVELVECRARDVPRADSYFDLVTCLNVVDRHPKPAMLVEILRSLLRPGGFLCLASPLDWRPDHTNEEHWIEDVEVFLDRAVWEVTSRVNLEYCFRAGLRRTTSFVSQVVCARLVE